MPLFAKGRIEVYLPDLPKSSYQNLLQALDEEFTYTFGGCTIIRGLEGSYLSNFGEKIQDRISLIYTDTPFSFQDNSDLLSNYTDEIRNAALEALEEEVVLIAVWQVYHSS
ncbi:MAG: hypothetical protein LH472_05210 [Pyrinomonadaceae bacterium]|nr:hypothetical protein [Pyrinomonadaceae bacterium]